MSAHNSPTPPHFDFWAEIKANALLWIRVDIALRRTIPLRKEGAVNPGKLWDGMWPWMCLQCGQVVTITYRDEIGGLFKV